MSSGAVISAIGLEPIEGVSSSTNQRLFLRVARARPSISIFWSHSSATAPNVLAAPWIATILSSFRLADGSTPFYICSFASLRARLASARLFIGYLPSEIVFLVPRNR